jgi:2-oxoglutarate dehydrogenase E1 component
MDDRTLSPHNLAFLEELYEQYARDPGSLDPAWREFMVRSSDGAPLVTSIGPSGVQAYRRPGTVAAPATVDAEHSMLQGRVDRMISHFRLQGHLGADIDPLARPRRAGPDRLSLAAFGLGSEHLDRVFDAGRLFPGPTTLRAIEARLRRTYTRHIGVEYWHLPSLEEREWLRERMELAENEPGFGPDDKRKFLRTLARVANSDKFKHTKFIGAKRFSNAGSEAMIVFLETLIEEAGTHDVDEVLMGMAHRGRLSVLMDILGKKPEDVFSEFTGGDPWQSLGSGDVKYHKGYHRYLTTRGGKQMYLALAFNPSHLEAITPVIAGRVRASQDRRDRVEDKLKILGVTMHGDAAIVGQGVYAETLNFAGLPGYTNHGTVRLVINNQVGFTTNPEESRTSVYCTANADMLGVPIFHVNGDDPEAVAYVARLAVQYRQTFRKDVVVDLIGYRRYGHNEGDEPTFTQPKMYAQIAAHKPVRELYQGKLEAEGTVDAAWCAAMDAEITQEFEAALSKVKGGEKEYEAKSPMHGIWVDYRGGLEADTPDVPTAVDDADVQAVRRAITTVPEGFHLHRKVAKAMEEIDEMLRGQAPLSWAAAEYLAYGGLLRGGHDVRISGQDAVRGTFNHRHAGWTDVETEARHFPLAHVADPGQRQGRFHVVNSPLSEYAVVGFEYGYTLAAPETLTIWEAQFGDFCNGAQIMIDQFVSSCEDKWNRLSGLVMLLPHGYEGQGPEHSSARLERFLQLAAEDNMQVCNFSTPAQLFHALRRQLLRRWRKPLIVMTPKSLLRTRTSFSPLHEFTAGSFARVLDDPYFADRDPASVQRLMLCSGKVFYDLQAARSERGLDASVALVRVEQLYPFPAAGVRDALAKYAHATDLVWAQEEPKNMGAWSFMAPRLAELAAGRFAPTYIGRAESASPATGSPESHKLELDLILADAFAGLGGAS